MSRPKPEHFLETIAIEEQSKTKGCLKIFFGYAAGVGKTYAMLKVAGKIKKEGMDVICGYIEPHSRPDTMRLAGEFEAIPIKYMEYNNLQLREMDLDGILTRKPQLVLVDELAHTNAAGSRHEKRYQDVEELLNAGIDVYTTVNVQHLESLCDIVASVTGVVVRERIPDHIFDNAEEVQLVDVEPKELMQRLSAGKIYEPNQAKRALNNFFTEENLTALREIALRRTADRVNLISEKTKRISGNEYYTEEKIAVGISSSPSNPKIIRAAARMAQAFGGRFIGIFVEMPDFEDIGDENKKRLKNNMHLAEQLGAQIETIVGEDIAVAITEYARTCGISKMVMGRSNTKRSIFGKASFVERLTTLAPNLEIYIIPDSSRTVRQAKARWSRMYTVTNVTKDFINSVAILAICTAIGFLFYNWGFGVSNIITVYILGVMISGIVTASRLFSIGLSILSVLVFNFFFTEPRFSLNAADPGYPVTFAIMFFAALISSSIASKLKQQAKDLAKSAYRTKVLLDTNQLLQKKKDILEIGEITSTQLVKLLNKDVVFYPTDKESLQEPIVYQTEESTESGSDFTGESEKAVAAWVYKNNKHAGAGTGTLGDSACYYLAIRNLSQVYGVIGIRVKQGEMLASFENSLIFAILAESAEVMEKETLRRQRELAAEQMNSEKLRANLLRSISHDLRTPLTSISGNAGMLLENKFDEASTRKICTDIYDDSMWLINLVENLLSVTRIEEGTMKIRKQAEMLEDIIVEAMKHINRRSSEYDIRINMEDEMQLVKVDSGLIVQVMINIIDNAIKYTPVGSRIEINTKKMGNQVRVEITDDGEGIADENKQHVFEMFYTANEKIADSRRSLGLGLALCKSIINAHGGEIYVKNNNPHGSKFQFTIQAEEVAIHD